MFPTLSLGPDLPGHLTLSPASHVAQGWSGSKLVGQSQEFLDKNKGDVQVWSGAEKKLWASASSQVLISSHYIGSQFLLSDKGALAPRLKLQSLYHQCLVDQGEGLDRWPREKSTFHKYEPGMLHFPMESWLCSRMS